MARAGLIQRARWKPGMYQPTKEGRDGLTKLLLRIRDPRTSPRCSSCS
jgi:hypothetical protein